LTVSFRIHAAISVRLNRVLLATMKNGILSWRTSR